MAKKDAEYLLFIEWIALPFSKRVPKEQKDFAKKYGLNVATLSEWKKKKGFWDLVRENIKQWAKNQTADVVQSIYTAATMPGEKGQAANAKLWLQYIEDWAEKKDIGLYDLEKEQRAKSLVDVYNKFDDTESANPKTTLRKAGSNSRVNKRSTGSKAAKSTAKGTKKKRSNPGTRRRILQKQRRKAV